ncbi:MAG: histidine kinase dimerization/phospho-acceptor domain-containing protein, partial [Rhizomicrobium sp.]
MKHKLWPRTLVVQLIAVTAAALVISNLAVAWWFARGNEMQSETSLTERVVDRAAAVATTLAAIPPSSRGVVMKTMSTHFWHFTELPASYPIAARPMNEEERGFAQRLATALPPQVRFGLFHVQLHESPRHIPPELLPEDFDKNAEAFRLTIPLDDHTKLSAVFLRTPPRWPVEIIVAAAAAILVASIAAALMARRVARPLYALTKAASIVARGGPAPHVEEKGPDDVRNAAIAFNQMTEKVARTMASQRQLLSAVGHDLRTPITAMRINLEFVQDEELREGLEQNLDELQDLTEQVLAAARGASGESKRSVDLSALVESLCADLDDLGEPVVWQNHAPAPVNCRPNEIRRAVRNLIENAIAYGRTAAVRLDASPGQYEILVEDEGP